VNDLAAQLPTLEELKQRGEPTKARPLTDTEQARAKADKKDRPKHLETKRKSEALCKYHLRKWGCTNVEKVRDDLRIVGDHSIRISKDVDFRSDWPLLLDGIVRPVPTRVESKGITLRVGSKGLMGSFPLSNLSAKEREYLHKNRMRGGLSAIHLAWWFNGECSMVDFILWKNWSAIEDWLKDKAEHDKRFGGKSLRWHADRDLMGRCEIYKASGRWHLCHDHWLEPLLTKGEQPKLL